MEIIPDLYGENFNCNSVDCAICKFVFIGYNEVSVQRILCRDFFLLYRKLLSCKVKNAARGCAKAHSLFYERKKKRKQGKVSKNVMDYKLLLDMAVFAGIS